MLPAGQEFLAPHLVAYPALAGIRFPSFGKIHDDQRSGRQSVDLAVLRGANDIEGQLFESRGLEACLEGVSKGRESRE